MSIATLKKVTVCGLLKDKTEILASLQELGCMHLLPLRPPPDEIENVASPRAEAAYKALRFLTDTPDKRRQVTRGREFDVDRIVHEALDLRQELRDMTDRRDFLQKRIGDVEIWGDLDFPPHEALAGYRLWFYTMPVKFRRDLEALGSYPWQIMHTDGRLIHVVLIARVEPPADILPVLRTHTGALPLGELKARLQESEVEIEELTARREALTRFIYLLSVNLAEAENSAALAYADQQTRDEESIVAVQGWVPIDEIAAFEEYAIEAGLAWLIEEPRADEEPPTLIDEPPEMAAGADLAMFYQVPNYRAWDPSKVLFFSFSVFFAMILSDAGYGLVLLGLLLAYRKRILRGDKGKGYFLMGLSLFGMAIAYGAAVGSYFGVPPAEGSLFGAIQFIDINNYPAMMQFSISIGVLHLVMANALIAWSRRRRLSAIAHLGWIAVLIGGVLFAFSDDGVTAKDAGMGLLVAGIVAVFLFSSERSLSANPKNLLFRLLDGVKALTGLMSMFGDVLSYMRLFALGLAGASLALTFNNLAMQVEESVPGLGLLLAILLLVVGHVMNLGLSIMSGIVHGLRLNFMEFYKWGLPEEGEPFRRFARKEVQS